MYHSSGLISPFQQQPNYDITANGAIQTSSTASSASGGPAAVDSIQQLEQLVHSNLEGGQQAIGQQPSSLSNLNPYYAYQYLASAAAATAWSAASIGGNGSTPNLDSGGINKKGGGRMTYNAEQKRILEHCFSIGKYVSKGQRGELMEKTQLTDKQIKIWFQNRRMKKRILEDCFRANKYVTKNQRADLVEKTQLKDAQIKIWFQNRRMKDKKTRNQQGDNTMGNGEMTHQESPSSFSPSNVSYQQQRHSGGIVEAGEGATEMALANVKSEPENGIGIGGNHQQQQQMKSEHNQQEGNGIINNGSAVSSYPPYEYSTANPLQQQFPPQGCGPQANSTTNFLSSTYPAYYNNPYVQQAAQQQFYQHYHPTMAAMNLAASNWYANATGGFVGGQHVAAGVELERKFENDVNGRLGNHLLKRE